VLICVDSGGGDCEAFMVLTCWIGVIWIWRKMRVVGIRVVGVGVGVGVGFGFGFGFGVGVRLMDDASL